MPATNDKILDGLGVARETISELQDLCALVLKWNVSINLIAKSGEADIWDRHIVDSVQLFKLAPAGVKRWCDLGSGGGFPALPLAVLAKTQAPDLKMMMIESDARKAVFLREAVRIHKLNAIVENGRAESVDRVSADIVSARALAPLDLLLAHAQRHLAPDGLAIFPKGEQAASEIENARRTWRFNLRVVPSQTDPKGSILLVDGLKHDA